jgi:hypothetical protein
MRSITTGDPRKTLNVFLCFKLVFYIEPDVIIGVCYIKGKKVQNVKTNLMLEEAKVFTAFIRLTLRGNV